MLSERFSLLEAEEDQGLHAIFFFPMKWTFKKKYISQREKSPLIRNSFGLHIQRTISVVSWGVSGHLIYLSKCFGMIKLVTPLSQLFPVSYGTESPCHFAESGDRAKGSIVSQSWSKPGTVGPALHDLKRNQLISSKFLSFAAFCNYALRIHDVLLFS